MNAPVRNLAWMAKHHFGKLRVASFVLCLSPALWLGGEWLSGSLGVNPLNRLLHFTGRWALIMALISLTVTPARRFSVMLAQVVHARYGKRLSDWNWLIRLRRQIGLFTFFYACLHAAIYLVFDAGFDATSLRDDMQERPFMLLGVVAFALLVPLAATSNQAAMRALGRGWRRLHTLSYLIAILALTHFWLQMKVGQIVPLPYGVVLVLLLGARGLAWRRGDRAAASELKDR